MDHKIITQILDRVELAKKNSDTDYFMSLLLLGEAILKTVTSTFVCAIAEDPDKNRYRLEHKLVRASGLGEWSAAIDDCLTGPAAQFLVPEAREERKELTQKTKAGDWRYDTVALIKDALDLLGIASDDVPIKTNFQRWFILFSTLRNKTRGHGALVAEKYTIASLPLEESLRLIYENSLVLSRPWAYLHQNLSGKYRVSMIAGDPAPFERYRGLTAEKLENGIYRHFGAPAPIALIKSSAELRDFFFANGGLTNTKFECLSYATGETSDGDAERYAIPPGRLPGSETEGMENLDALDNCFVNLPTLSRDYVPRKELEDDLLRLLRDNRHPVVTLVGRGGIGKTSLALATLPKIAKEIRFEAIIWFSARDIDLQESGPKAVRPHVLNEEQVAKYFVELLNPPESGKGDFSAREYLEKSLGASPIGPTLFVFDNFETTSNPTELFKWIDTFVRNPNKVLITTRLRNFKGDYPIDVWGMTEEQSLTLIEQTAATLGIKPILTSEYIQTAIAESGGHPYVIKILLGEVAKEGRPVNVKRLVAGNEGILIALFERTYASLSEAARRVFLTLVSWNSAVPRLALEAVLLRPENERSDVGEAIEVLLKSSMIEFEEGDTEDQMLLTLPLVAREFGRKKLNVSPMKTAIHSDREILQMLGVHKSGHPGAGLKIRVERFVGTVARQLDEEEAELEQYRPILEMIARSYTPAWLLLARLYSEGKGEDFLKRAKEAYQRYLESESDAPKAADAWQGIAHLCRQSDDTLGEIHAFVERAQLSAVAYWEVSNTANRLNVALSRRDLDLPLDERRIVVSRLLQVMERRKSEAEPKDYSRMAWLALNLNEEERAIRLVEEGIERGATDHHIMNLQERLKL